MASTKSKTACPHCQKSFINLALHHTKMHAVFTRDGGHLLKDGVCFGVVEMVGTGGNDKGDYILHEPTDERPDGHTYRLYDYENGNTELWRTTCADGRHGSKNNATYGGADSTLITTKIPHHESKA